MRKSHMLAIFAATLALSGCLRKPSVEQYAEYGVAFAHGSDWSVKNDGFSKENPRVMTIKVQGPHDALVMIILTPAAGSGTLGQFAAAVAKGRAENIKRTLTVGSLQAGDAS